MPFTHRWECRHEVLAGYGPGAKHGPFFSRTGPRCATSARSRPQRLDDAIIIAKAFAETRIILTHDLDFGRFIALGRYQLPSVITFRLSDMRAYEVNRRLSEVLSRFATQLLEGAMISVTDQSIRVRQLPMQREAWFRTP